MDVTKIDFADERPARWLMLYNRRFFDWLVFPALVVPIVIVQLHCIAANQCAWAAALVVLCSPLAWLHWRIRVAILRFWFELHRHVLAHGRTVVSGPAQPAWYRNVRQWLKRNRLTGGFDSYWCWPLRDCRQFSRLYEILQRREQEVEASPPADTDNDVAQINSMLTEMRDLMEELGPISELILCAQYRWAVLLQTAFCFATALLAPIVWFDPGLPQLKKSLQVYSAEHSIEANPITHLER